MVYYYALVGINEASLIEFNSKDDLLYISNDSIEITWDQHSLLPQALVENQDVIVTVDIHLAEINAKTGRTQTIRNLASNIVNSGQHSAVIPLVYEDVLAAAVQITIANVQSRDPLRSLVSHLENVYNQIKLHLAHWSKEIYLSGSNVLQDQCERWYRTESEEIRADILQRLPACPPTESRIMNIFVKEDYGDTFREFFHPGTSSCYRQSGFTR